MRNADEIRAFFEKHRSSRVDEVRTRWLTEHGIRLHLKREDLLHPSLPGNKWRKLKYNLIAAAEHGERTIATFGGAWSNHIAAVAAAGQLFGFRTTGFIRGEEHLPLNHVLEQATRDGMEIHYLDRERYRIKHETGVEGELRRSFGPFLLLPEGGSNELAVRGCEEILNERDSDFDLVCCPVGTGGTLAGIVRSLRANQRALGFSVLKGGGFLRDQVATLAGEWAANRRWDISLDHHAGGYAKSPEELLDFIAEFEIETGIPLDPIYTGKMLWGIQRLVREGNIGRGTSILAIHTANHPKNDQQTTGATS